MNVAVHDSLSGNSADIDPDVVSIGWKRSSNKPFPFVNHGPERRLFLRDYRKVVGNVTIRDD